MILFKTGRGVKYLTILGRPHDVAEKFENAVLFLRRGLAPTLIRYEHRALRKRSSNRKNLKMQALRFSVDGNIFKTRLFENDDVTIIMFGLFSRDSETSVFKSSVHTTLEEFKNGSFTLKTHQMFSVHTKTQSPRFQIPPVSRAFSKSFVFVTD